MRDFPPVDPLPELPERLSQTALARHDVCPRSAYLYLLHGGGKASHAMDRGSAFHETVEILTKLAVERGELVPWEVGQAVLAEVLERDVNRVIPVGDHERLRQMVWHWCEFGLELPLDRVAGVEQLLLLEADGIPGLVSGKLDLVLVSENVCEIRDYKTSLNMPSQEDFEASFQPRCYAVLAAFGTPEGSPFALGAGVNHFRMTEIYPALDPRKTVDGRLAQRSFEVDRPRVLEWREDLERGVSTFADRLEAWQFPARDGSWCSTCAAPYDCPIPAQAREIQPITSEVQAREAATEWRFAESEAATLKASVRAYAVERGLELVPLGGDEALAFSYSESRSVQDADKLLEAVERAAELGEPFNPADHFRIRKSNTFRKRKLRPDERAA